MRDRGLVQLGFLGVPYPPGDPDFRLPDWTPMKAAEHMDLVEEIYLWSVATEIFALIDPEKSRKIYEEKLSKGIMPDEVRQVQWLSDYDGRSVADELHARADEIGLYSSRFDLDMDGVVDTVYRMIQINPFRHPKTRLLNLAPLSRYRNPGLPGMHQMTVYYIRRDGPNNPTRVSWGLRTGEIFFWRDRVFLMHPGGGSVSWMRAIVSGRPAKFAPGCTYHIEGKKGGM